MWSPDTNKLYYMNQQHLSFYKYWPDGGLVRPKLVANISNNKMKRYLWQPLFIFLYFILILYFKHNGMPSTQNQRFCFIHFSIIVRVSKENLDVSDVNTVGTSHNLSRDTVPREIGRLFKWRSSFGCSHAVLCSVCLDTSTLTYSHHGAESFLSSWLVCS